jgi:hypothetical protein
MSFKIWVQPAIYTISYSLSGTATNKELSIDVNTINVVFCNDDCSGTITVSPGDTVDIFTSCFTSPPSYVSLDVNVIDNGTLVHTTFQTELISATDSYSYTPTGNGSISVVANEYS